MSSTPTIDHGLRRESPDGPIGTIDVNADPVSMGGARPALLVSVRNVAEACHAIDGGCEILDVKEPSRGSLGMADRDEIAGIVAIRNERAPDTPVSVALGEAAEWEAGDSREPARALACGGIHFLKLGTAGLGTNGSWRQRFCRARSRCESFWIRNSATPAPRWVAVAYADWRLADSPAPAEVIAAAADYGCAGLLIDTFTKSGAGLFHWLSIDELRQLAAAVRRRRMWFALAGRLALEDIARLHSVAPDIVGIRTAACRGGLREGEIDLNAVKIFRRELASQRWGQRHPSSSGPARPDGCNLHD